LTHDSTKKADARDRVVYYSINAQWDNLGDIEIRNTALEWIRKSGSRTVAFVGAMPEGYIDTFDIDLSVEWERNSVRYQVRLWKSILTRRASIVFAPGPQVFGPRWRSMVKSMVNFANVTGVRLSGGKVLAVGRSLRGRGALAARLESAIVDTFQMFVVRDTRSAEVLGRNLLNAPDLAFEHTGVVAHRRDLAVISLRGDRAIDSVALGLVVQQLAAQGLTPVLVTQVRRDDDQHKLLAETLGIRALLWDGHSHVEQMRLVRETYAQAQVVVSNRLHALIFGMQSNAVPVAVLDVGSDKLTSTLQPWVTLHHTPANFATLDGEPWSQIDLESDSQRLSGDLNSARAALAHVRTRFIAELSSATRHGVANGEVKAQQSARRRVAITQPYVPAYREPLWARVISQLEDNDVDCRVFFGGDSEQLAIRARRGDGVEPKWAMQIATRTFQPKKDAPKFLYRRLPKGWRSRDVLLVTEMQALNLNAWQAALTGRRYVTLGHGWSETTSQNGIATKLENHLNRRSAHVLTYTEQGRNFVVKSGGVPKARVTSFRNSTDTTRLKEAMSSVSAASEDAFRLKHRIPVDAKIAFYLGALNAHKNIDLLVDAARLTFAESAEWWLVVAGDGAEAWKVRDLARETGRVVMLGQVPAVQFATAARLASVLLNPGRVGLVAVDALIMGLPILTTPTGARAPEYEYLRPGVDVFEVGATPASFAKAWTSWTPVKPPPHSDVPSVEAAAETISLAILAELRRGQ
jgi:glycosyltransferase involved in cell wall biosynthesis